MNAILTKFFARNGLFAKLKRTVTSVLPVEATRKGECKRCGACCKLPFPCQFLATDNDGLCVCKVYWLRPLNCRKYPRSKSEFITADTCGYSFDGAKD